MNKNFIKKNITTILMVAATVVLGGIAVFTAVRLYQLRTQTVAPTAPESEPGASSDPVKVTPKSGNWNYPETFTVTNITSEALEIRYHLDCWDESVCEDERDTVILARGESFEKGLGNICSKWQLDLGWTDDPEWDWGFIAEESRDCNGQTSTPTATASSTPTTTATASPTASSTATPISTTSPTPSTTTTPSPELEECTVLTFSLSSSTPTSSATPTASATATPSSSQTPSSTSTPSSTTTPKSTSTTVATTKSTSSPVAQASSTPPSLPAAGVSTPTILGIGAGIILLLGAVLFAL